MRKSKYLSGLLWGGAALSCGISPATAQSAGISKNSNSDEIIVVTGTRSGQNALRNTGSLTVITTDQIINRQVRQISEVLRDVPGIAVSETPGQSQLRLRGSEANHVLFLIDGIEVSDAYAGEFDVSSLIADDAAQIEVLRGQQSALYGSDAIGGVIHYRTLNGKDAPGLSARVEGGSDNSFNGAARFGGGTGDFNYAFTSAVTSTDGRPNARGGTRNLGRDTASFGFLGNVAASDDLRFGAVVRYTHSDGELNFTENDSTAPLFGQIIDTPGARYENRGLYGLVKAELDLLDDVWTHRISAQFANNVRRSFVGAVQQSGSTGKRLKASYETTAKFVGTANEHRVTFAADLEREKFRNGDPSGFAFTGERSSDNLGLVGLYEFFAGNRASFSAAVRYDDNELFADATTYRVQAGYLLPTNTRVHAAYGTGVKNPGFFELFGFFDGRFIGNPDLTPEKSEGWEIGLTQQLAGDAGNIGVTYFDSRLEDEIFTTFLPPTFAATPANRETLSKRSGVESSLDYKINDVFQINASYTYLRSRENGVQEVRRPKHSGSVSIDWNLDDKAGITLIGRYNGTQRDSAFTDPSFIPVDVRLDDYLLVNLNGRVALNEQFELFGRVDNMLNERYEQIFSFVSPGRSVYAGIRGSF